MSISVIVPVFNRASMVVEAVESVLSQTLQPIEVILIDDGSTDSTPAVLQQLQSNNELIKVLTINHSGVSAARNTGIRYVHGEWIAFLDSDDMWLSEKLERQVEKIQANPDLRVVHTDETWVKNEKTVKQLKHHIKPEGNIYLQCLPLCCVSPSAILMHKDVLQQVGLFDEQLPACEDYDLWLRIFNRFPIGLVKEPLVVKRGGHTDQLSTKHWGMDRFRVYALDKMLQSDDLDADKKEATIGMLNKKCDILISGAKKRNNQDLLEYCEELKKKWKPVEV